MHNDSSTTAPLRVLIIGAGFGGIGLAIQLDKAGQGDFLILEKAAEVGGTWRDNHYPGAACDVPSHLYSYSFEPKADWSRKYAPQAEIHGYIRHCVDKYGLANRIRCNTEVSHAEFDEAKGLWQVHTRCGQTYACAQSGDGLRPAQSSGLSAHRRVGAVRRPGLPLCPLAA